MSSQYQDAGGAYSLEWRNVTIRTGDKAILDNVSGFLPAGETLAILGPSGSGKTTLLSLLAGVFRPRSSSTATQVTGQISVGGGPFVEASEHPFSPHMAQIRIVEQYDTFLGSSTVWEHLMLNAKLRLSHLRSDAEREESVVKILDRLRLGGFESVRIVALSGGQKKRLSVAEELLSEPAILFLDEPTSGLDSTVAREVVEIFYPEEHTEKMTKAVYPTLSDDAIMLAASPGPRPRGRLSSSMGGGYPTSSRQLLAQEGDEVLDDDGDAGDDLPEVFEDGTHLPRVESLSKHSQRECKEASVKKSLVVSAVQEDEDMATGGQVVEVAKQQQKNPWDLARARIAAAAGILLFEGSAMPQRSTNYRNETSSTTIIYTIHQPSSLVWSWFRSTLFLAAGETIYFGPAKEVIPYLEKHLGSDCAKGHSASEYVLDTLNCANALERLGAIRAKEGHAGAELRALQELGRNKASMLKDQDALEQVKMKRGSTDEDDSRRSMYAPWCTQFSVLWNRVFRDRLRDFEKTVLQVSANIFVCVIVGMCMFRVGVRPQDQGARIGAVMLVASFPLTAEVIASCMYLIMLRPQVEREYTTKRLYHLFPYWLAQRTGNILTEYMFVAGVYSTFMFFLVGYFPDYNATKYFTLLLLLLLVQTVAHGYGNVLGTLVVDPRRVSFLVSLFVLPFMYVSPLSSPGLRIPVWLAWLQYISPYYWCGITLVWWAWSGYTMTDLNPSAEDLRISARFCVFEDGQGVRHACEGIRPGAPTTAASPTPAPGGQQQQANLAPKQQQQQQQGASLSVWPAGNLTPDASWKNGGKPFLFLDGSKDILQEFYKIDPNNPWRAFYLPLLIMLAMIIFHNLLAFFLFSLRYKYQSSCSAMCAARKRRQAVDKEMNNRAKQGATAGEKIEEDQDGEAQSLL
ncbi:unnamed protein product [Amoebophrya sp. A25]|nr:unnamed protein product [Amoebophrya sp. A25]|eukprot:GSA25T00025292001.1